MNKLASLVERSKADILIDLGSFNSIYCKQPLSYKNIGGLGPAGSFNLYRSLRLFPNTHTIIESGVWRGASTWLLEQALPNLKTIYCLDPNVDNVDFYRYRSPKASYSSIDFLKQAWNLPDPANTLVFFDDHQDVLPRLLRCKELSLKNIILDDNYDSLADHQTTFTLTPEQKILIQDSSLYVFPRLYTKNPSLDSIWKPGDIVPAWLTPYLEDSLANYMFLSLFQWS